MAKRDQTELDANVATLTAEHGWEDVDAGDVEKWESGVTVLGTFLRLKEGSLERQDGGKAKLLMVRDQVSGKARVFGCPAILEGMLEDFQPGDGIYIACLGKTRDTAGTRKYGNKAWAFQVKRKKA